MPAEIVQRIREENDHLYHIIHILYSGIVPLSQQKGAIKEAKNILLANYPKKDNERWFVIYGTTSGDDKNVKPKDAHLAGGDLLELISLIKEMGGFVGAIPGTKLIEIMLELAQGLTRQGLVKLRSMDEFEQRLSTLDTKQPT